MDPGTPIEAAPRTEALRDAVDVWLCDPATLDDPVLRAACEALMSTDERRKAERYRFEKDQRLCIIGRAMLRTALSRYADLEPRAWRFEVNAYGCPRVQPPVAGAPLRFNLSHTEGLVACAVALDRDVGVDVEVADREADVLAIAHRYLSTLERDALVRQPAELQRARFYEYWTLKEAYIKAREQGLSIPLADFSCLLDEGPRIGVTFTPALADDASSWQLHLERPTPRHLLALAVRRGTRSDLAIRVRWTGPLVERS